MPVATKLSGGWIPNPSPCSEIYGSGLKSKQILTLLKQKKYGTGNYMGFLLDWPQPIKMQSRNTDNNAAA